MKNNWEREGAGLIERGAYSLSSPEKRGGGLIRGRGLFGEGGLIEDFFTP